MSADFSQYMKYPCQYITSHAKFIKEIEPLAFHSKLIKPLKGAYYKH